MGRRELYIALAFIVAGVVAFQFTAPPAPEREGGFSLSRLINEARREIRGSQSYTAPPRSIDVAVEDAITDIRILGSAGPITITGTDRPNVHVVLTVSSTGESEAAAVAVADKTVLGEDRVGGILTLQVRFPEEERQTSRMVVEVPRRLGVRLDAPRDVTITGVRTVDLANGARGTTDLSAISGAVTGEQTSGTFTLNGAGGVRMTLSRTRARIGGVSGAANLEIRDGETEISGGTGALEIDERRGDITVRGHAGPVTVSGSDGRLRLSGVTKMVRVDVRRVDVEADLMPGVPASLVTAEEPLHVSWPEPGGVRIDAIATDGAITASEWGLSPVVTGADQRLDQSIGARAGAAPTVAIRNQGANIVLRKSSKK